MEISSPRPSTEYVVLVNERDEEVGVAEKHQAHRSGLLHRALSVCLFNSEGALLLQRRHAGKYHSGGLWTNTCCSHPRPEEPVDQAAQRRLHEEMGLSCDLRRIHTFVYRTAFPNGLVEHEFDHLFVGSTDATPRPDPAEVDDWAWVRPSDLVDAVRERPEAYTYWFRLMLPELLRHAPSP